MSDDVITIRTHHLMCVADGAAHNGTNPALPGLLKALRANPDHLIRVIVGPDDICLPCPYWNSDTCTCEKGYEEMNQRKDARYLEILGLSDGETLPARRLYQTVTECITLEHMKEVCGECRYERCTRSAKDSLSTLFGEE